MFNTYNTLNNNILNFLFNLGYFELMFLQMFEQCSLTPLVSCIVFILIFVFFEVAVVFVDWVVGQVDVHIFVFGGVFVFLTGETGQAFILKVHAEGVVGCDDDLESDVEFEVIDQHWVVQVFRY